MTIHDRIYGTFHITDPLIVALINTKTLIRLKTISMFGVPNEFYHLKNYSRFEHSIGVMLLLKKLGASREEQIAGLLHDISHTAFSHVIDWVIGSGKTEDYQDQTHLAKLMRSDVTPHLAKHGFNPAKIADYHRFPLLEQPAPDLCADRLDYGLREIPAQAAATSVRGLVVVDNRICFKDRKSAWTFAHYYLRRQVNHWGGFEAVSRYRLFADACKLAMNDQTIALADFQNDESSIIAKLNASKNSRIQRILAALRHPSLAKYPESKKVYHKKFRFVDPGIVNKGGKRLSEVDNEFNEELKEALKENEKGIQIADILTSL